MSWYPYPSVFHPTFPYPIPLYNPWTNPYILDPVDVRTQAEQMTSPFGPPLDAVAVALFKRWCASSETLAIVVDVINARLKLPPPQCLKALVLAEHLPDLSGLTDNLSGIKVKDDDGNLLPISYLINPLLARARETKEALANQSASKKWSLWVDHFGASEATLPNLPDEMRPKDPCEVNTERVIEVVRGVDWFKYGQENKDKGKD